MTVEVRTVVGCCDVGPACRVLDAVGPGRVVSGVVVSGVVVPGDRVTDRDGLGDSASVWSGATAERVGLGNVRVGDSEAVTDGRSPVACPSLAPSLAPHADRRHNARTHRMAQRAALRAARGGMRNLQPPGSGRFTMPPSRRVHLIPEE
jgi:hypothetical protein